MSLSQSDFVSNDSAGTQLTSATKATHHVASQQTEFAGERQS